MSDVTRTNTPDTEDNITLKKSTYKKLLGGLVIVLGIAAFASGYSIATFTYDDSITKEELKEILADIKSQPQPNIIQAPTQPPPIQQISLDDDPWIGNADASIIVVEFSDFQCPFCSRFFHDTMSQIKQDYVESGKVKFVFRDLPLESIHPNAMPAHIAAECADSQNKFWDYHDLLFERQVEWQRLANTEINQKLIAYANELGLDSPKFTSCLSDQSVQDEVRKDAMDAAKYGASGTPTFFIGNQKDGFTKLVGAQPFGSFQVLIDKKLN